MRCERCTGLVVADHFIGGASSIGGWAYCGWRCVNCGAIGLSGQAGAGPAIRGVVGGRKNDGKHKPMMKGAVR
jgi:hypothetical protein